MKSDEQMFRKLARFLRDNAMLVADARDSNAPWDLVEELDAFEAAQRKGNKQRKQDSTHD